MALLDAKSPLSYDDLSTLLSELDDDWVFDFLPIEPLLPVDIIPSKPHVIRSKKPRRYVRADILNTRCEIEELKTQLHHLRDKHKVREMLKTAKSDYGLNWRLLASQEWILKTRSCEVNNKLRKHVDSNTQLIQSLFKLIRHQSEIMPKSVQIDYRIVAIENRAHVYRVLRTCLDIRSKGQLDAIINHCSGIPADSICNQRERDWNVFSLENRGVGVEFHERITLPFRPSFISGAFRQWSFPNVLQISSSDEPSCSHNHHQLKLSSLDQRLILRKVVDVNVHTLMLWEDALCVQSDQNASSVSVRGSGWTTVIPVVQYGNEWSVVHYGGLIQIQASEGESILLSDVLTKDIVSYAQSMQMARMASLETVLINTLKYRSQAEDASTLE